MRPRECQADLSRQICLAGTIVWLTHHRYIGYTARTACRIAQFRSAATALSHCTKQLPCQSCARADSIDETTHSVNASADSVNEIDGRERHLRYLGVACDAAIHRAHARLSRARHGLDLGGVRQTH